MNTPNRGQFRWIVFKDGKEWVGVALEFNIVIVGDNPRVVETELQEAAIGYVEATKEIERKVKGLRPTQIDGILNQRSDEEYEARWITAQEAAQGNVPSPLSPDIYRFGMTNLANA